MQIQDFLYYMLWAGLFFVIMRFGCGAHIMGHGHHDATAVPEHAPKTRFKPPVPER
jgi:hypothetical protein